MIYDKYSGVFVVKICRWSYLGVFQTKPIYNRNCKQKAEDDNNEKRDFFQHDSKIDAKQMLKLNRVK